MADHLDRLKAVLADRYRIEREIGRGGMATVYLAEDLKHDRKVAVKVLHPELAAALGSERFLREIKLTASLQHPNILPVHDSGDTDGFLYYVMPYVAGESLRDRLNRETQLPVEDALRIAHEVADALSYSHGQGVIHRDIKPENILLSAGHAEVADFGIALAVSAAGGDRLTETGFSVGTPEYMSPEQATGDRVDSRSDMYSLACVLYEMLTGEPPYIGANAQAVIAKRLSDPVPSARRLRTTMPEPVDAALTRALARVPADRFHTIDEFVEAFTASGEVAHAAMGRDWLARRFSLAGLVAVLVLTVALVSWWAWAGANRTSDIEQIAVLPCANRTNDPDQEYVAAGVHDEVIAGLGKIAGIVVKGRTSVARYRETDMSVPEIAEALQVQGLVECSVFRLGDSVRVSASLRDAQSDRQLWSDSYSRKSREIFLLAGDVVGGITAALNAPVSSGERARLESRPTENLEADTHYRRGLYLLHRASENELRRSIEHFDDAIALDSNFASAYAQKAVAYSYLGDVYNVSGTVSTVEWMPTVRELVIKALDLDNELADAHGLLAYIRWAYDYDYAAAEREAKLATELAPTDATAWLYYAEALSVLGRDEEAVAAGLRGVELDPAQPFYLSWLSAIFQAARRWQASLESAENALQLDANLSIAYVNAGTALLFLGRHDESIAMYERGATLADHPAYLGWLGGAHARTGNRPEAERILRELNEMSRQRFVGPRAFTWLHLGLKNYDEAIASLKRSADLRAPGANLFDLRTPWADELRDHPEYGEVLRMMRLER